MSHVEARDLLSVVVVATASFFALTSLIRCTEPPADPVPAVRVDTVYAPPPGFIEGFRLRCEWVPEEEV